MASNKKVVGKYRVMDKEGMMTEETEIYERVKDARDHWVQNYKPKFDKMYKNFRDNPDDRLEAIKAIGGEDWMSNLFVPLTSSNVRTILPRVVDSKPQLIVLPREEEDAKRSKHVQAAMEYTWEVSKADKEVQKYVTQALIYGGAMGKAIWDYQARSVQELKKVNRNDDGDVEGMEWEDTLKIDYDDNTFKCVDVHGGFFPDPLCGDDLSLGRYHCQRFLLTKEQACQRYVIDDDKKEHIMEGTGDLTKYDEVRLEQSTRYNDQVKRTYKNTGKSSLADGKLLEVIEYWEKDRLVLIFGDMIVRDTPNPYNHKEYPFVRVSYEELPFEFWGNGVPQQLEQVQDGLNSIRNQRIDNVTMSIHKMFIIDPTSFVNENDLKVRPFGLVRSANPGAVTPIEFGDVKSSAFAEDDRFMEAGRMATGIDDYSRGLGGAASTSATAVTMQKESTLERVKLFIQNLEIAYSEIMRLWLSNMQQFYEETKVQKIIGGSMQEVSKIDRPFRTKKNGTFEYPLVGKDDLKGNYDFIIGSLSSMSASKELRRKNNEAILDRTTTAGQGIVDQRAVWSKVFEDLDWEPEMYLLPEQQGIQGQGGEMPQELLNLVGGGQPPAIPNVLTSGQESGNVLTEPFNNFS